MNVSPSIEYILSDLRGLVAGTDGLESEGITRFLERKDAFFDEPESGWMLSNHRPRSSGPG